MNKVPLKGEPCGSHFLEERYWIHARLRGPGRHDLEGNLGLICVEDHVCLM